MEEEEETLQPQGSPKEYFSFPQQQDQQEQEQESQNKEEEQEKSQKSEEEDSQLSLELQRSYQKQVDDMEIKQLIFDNKIPVKITMDQEDVALDQEDPAPLYLFFYRIHYVMQYYQRIQEAFQRYSPPPLGIQSMWLEYEGKLLPWNDYVGVFADIYLQEVLENMNCENGLQKTNMEVIELKLHFRYNSTNVSQFEYSQKDFLHETGLYKFQLKQALSIRYKGDWGIGKLTRDTSVYDQKKIWDSLQNLKAKQFYQMFGHFFWDFQLNNKNMIKKAPIRIHIRDVEGRVEFGSAIYTDEEETEQKLLGQVFCEQFPDLVKDKEECYEINKKYRNLKILTQGIEIQLNTPIKYLDDNLKYPNGFINLVVFLNED